MSDNKNKIAENTEVLNTINKVEGFNPATMAVDYKDLNTGEVRKRLPVMAQMGWFRLKYPEGKIAVSVTTSNGRFVATARIYPNYKDPADCYLAEATASRAPDPSKPSVSPREWAQTAAVGIALRNAGFGLQFGAAGDEFEGDTSSELIVETQAIKTESQIPIEQSEKKSYEPVKEVTQKELTLEERVQAAMNVPCPIKKYDGKTLGEVAVEDPAALNWVVNKYKGSSDIIEAAKLICEYALNQQASY